MNSASQHDPVALFTFALRERDWVLAELIARALRREPRTTERLEMLAAVTAANRPSPASLRQLRGWAAIARMLEIGD